MNRHDDAVLSYLPSLHLYSKIKASALLLRTARGPRVYAFSVFFILITSQAAPLSFPALPAFTPTYSTSLHWTQVLLTPVATVVLSAKGTDTKGFNFTSQPHRTDNGNTSVWYVHNRRLEKKVLNVNVLCLIQKMCFGLTPLKKKNLYLCVNIKATSHQSDFMY